MSADQNQHVCPRKFKFFRVLLRDFSTTLALPQAPRLTNHFIKENLTNVTLLSPLGKSAWNVRIGGDSKLGLHFAEGWERFAAAHRLSFGDFLVFKYIGSTLFQVTIFDKSTCEKDCYNDKVTNIGNNIAGDDVPAGDDQGENGGHNQKEYSECFRSSPTILMHQESNKARDELSACKRKALQKPVHGHKAKDQGTEQQGGKRGSHFEITMTPKCKYEVIIPVKFARSNGLSGVRQMLLRDPSGGGPWPVNLIHCKRSIGQDRYSLGAGWRDFHVRNDLKDGDVCVFELKKKNKMAVQIRRSCEKDGSRRSKCRLQQLVQLKRAASVQPKGSPSKVARTSKQEDSALQFKSTIVPSNLCKNGYLNIPKAFHSSVDLSAEKEAIFVDPNYQRRWPVKIHHNPKRGRCWAGQGWEAFCEKNGVEIGDQCVFSFKYRGREATFQVEVIKSKAAGPKGRITVTTPPSSGQITPPVMEQESNKDKTQQVRSSVRKEVEKLVHMDKKATAQMCKWGSRFEITISTKRKYSANIPVEYVRSNDLSGVRQMLLRDPKGRPWPVNLVQYYKQSGFGHKYVLLSAGWRDFLIDNELKDGDVCIFELKKKNEMLVQIRRSCEEDGSRRSKISALQQAADQLNVDIAGDDAPGDDHGENSGDQKEYSECFRKQMWSACGRKGIQKPVRDKDATYKMGSHFGITISPKYKNAVIIPAKFARSNDLSNVYQMLLIRDPSSGRGGPWPRR